MRRLCRVEFIGGPEDGRTFIADYPPGPEYQVPLRQPMLAAVSVPPEEILAFRVGSYHRARSGLDLYFTKREVERSLDDILQFFVSRRHAAFDYVWAGE